jgi:replication fork protection complex subunit Tof1/Swi1
VPSSRHSRFGTTIAISTRVAKNTSGNNLFSPKKILVPKALVHTTAPIPLLLDANKRPVRQRNMNNAPALDDDLTPPARGVLRDFAQTLLKEGAFNTFVAGLLKDMRMERSWAVGENVGVWMLGVVRWAVAFFMIDGADGDKEKGKGKAREFGYVAAAADSGCVAWVLKRMREATEDKVPFLFSLITFHNRLSNRSRNHGRRSTRAWGASRRSSLCWSPLPTMRH